MSIYLICCSLAPSPLSHLPSPLSSLFSRCTYIPSTRLRVVVHLSNHVDAVRQRWPVISITYFKVIHLFNITSFVFFVCFYICYLLFVICYLLFVICYLLFVICYLLFVICYLLFVLFCFSFHTSNSPRITKRIPNWSVPIYMILLPFRPSPSSRLLPFSPAPLLVFLISPPAPLLPSLFSHLPSHLHSLTYHEFQPHSEKKTCLPVAFNASLLFKN